jgi:PAS domain S-box-containing protein
VEVSASEIERAGAVASDGVAAAMWRSYLESALDALIVTSVPGSSILTANSVAAQLVGWTVPELIGRNAFELVELSPEVVEGMADRERYGIAQAAVELIHREGWRIPAHLLSFRCALPDGEAVNVVIVREPRAATVSSAGGVQRWRRQLRDVSDGSKDVVFSVGVEDFRLLWFNRAMAEVGRVLP